jgi:DNA invertase Pin-like site-specific DNA recombinase
VRFADSSLNGPFAAVDGQAKAKAEGKYVGRPENKRRNGRIAAMLAAGTSYSAIQEATGCSRATVAKIAKRVAVA